MFDTIFTNRSASHSTPARLAAAPSGTGRLLAALLLLASPAVAQSGTWNKPTGGAWGTAGNWLEGTIPGGFYETADFSTQNLTANAIVTLDGTRTIGTLHFADTTPQPRLDAQHRHPHARLPRRNCGGQPDRNSHTILKNKKVH